MAKLLMYLQSELWMALDDLPVELSPEVMWYVGRDKVTCEIKCAGEVALLELRMKEADDG